jgi:hypothetical protein
LKQIRGFAKVFKPKFKGKQKEKRKKNKKKAEGPRGTILVQPEKEPTAQQEPPPEPLPLFSLSVTDDWGPLGIPLKQTGSSTARLNVISPDSSPNSV